MQHAIDKARVLVEALGWIRHFRGRYVIVKLGGSALDDEDGVRGVITDVVFMAAVGMKPILVHGGGKAISRAMNDSGIAPRFVQGRRYTDARTLDIVSSVLGELSAGLVERIQAQGAAATRVHCDDHACLLGERLQLTDQDGNAVDLGQVGRVHEIDRDHIADLCDQGIIPVLPCLAVSTNGDRLNVNGDTAAAAVARLLSAEKLVFLSDVPGIFADRNAPETLISHLDAAGCRKLIADGTIDAGMVPKVDAALEAVDAGVRKVHIVAAGMPHSLLLEVYSDVGVGTEIVP